MTEKKSITEARPPIVAIVGHIDHGKSTLLDYIRKSNVVEGEAGGITQHLSAYEATHTNASGEHRITFLDTPGHAAFRLMRSRGLEAADVAVLVVSAEDGAKPQTVEALKLLEAVKIPYVVALTKIDKPGVDIEKAKMSLLESGIYLEGLGGNTPYVALSSKTGQGVPELLDLLLLAAELEGISMDKSAPARGLVIEAHVDGKRGNTAMLIIKEGLVQSGEFIVAGAAMAPVRIMENFIGKPVREALAGSPVRVVGFSTLPQVGSEWHAVESKKEAERDVAEARTTAAETPAPLEARVGLGLAARSARAGEAQDVSAGEKTGLEESEKKVIVPLVIKTDFAGTIDAVIHEVEKLPQDVRLEVRVVGRGAGPINESDARLAGAGEVPGIIAGFNVKIDKTVRDLAERQGVAVGTFDIIYKLTEWLVEEIAKRRPQAHSEEKTGSAKILKIFSAEKQRVVLGGRVEEGELREGAAVRFMRRDLEIGRGEIVSLQSQKKAVKKVAAGEEFGAMLRTPQAPAAGDTLEAFEIVLK